jgi:hypothetical protein
LTLWFFTAAVFGMAGAACDGLAASIATAPAMPSAPATSAIAFFIVFLLMT